MTISAQAPGDVLRELREARGYTLTQLAKRAGVSATTIRNYERGVRDDGSSFAPNEGKVMKVAAGFPPEDRAMILEAFGMEERARNVKAEARATQPKDKEGQQFTVVGVVAGSTDTIIVRDEEGQHRIFRELNLRSSGLYGPDEAPF